MVKIWFLHYALTHLRNGSAIPILSPVKVTSYNQLNIIRILSSPSFTEQLHDQLLKISKTAMIELTHTTDYLRVPRILIGLPGLEARGEQ